MPIRGKWRNPALVRCTHKKAYSSEVLMMIDTQAEEALTAKVALMSEAEREARIAELYELPNTPENLLEFTKFMFGEDITLSEK
jgi:hypothetical protein